MRRSLGRLRAARLQMLHQQPGCRRKTTIAAAAAAAAAAARAVATSESRAACIIQSRLVSLHTHPHRRVGCRSFFSTGNGGQFPRFETHDDLERSLLDLTGDPLESTGARVVTFRGSPDARLMVIGEAPGAEEDKLGKPFVGRSGKLLDDILASVGFAERDVYITNIVKRRPPKNRVPLQWEILAYKPWLAEQLRLVDPDVVVLVGRTATSAVLKSVGAADAKAPISKLRGRWFTHDGTWLMPIFHPAYLLRNPSPDPGTPKSRTWHDLQEIRRKHDELAAKADADAARGAAADVRHEDIH